MNLPVCMLNPVPLSIHTAPLTLRLRVVFYFPRLRVIIRKMTYENHISRMQRTKKRFIFLFLRHGVNEGYIQEEKEFSHMNVSLIHPILTLNPPYRFVDEFISNLRLLHEFGVFKGSSGVKSSKRSILRDTYYFKAFCWMNVRYARMQ